MVPSAAIAGDIMGQAAFLIGFAFIGAVLAVANAASATETIIENVTVISPERSNPLPNANVVIRNGRIAAIGRSVTAGPRAKRIDGTGRFLIPGLIDTHVHVSHSAALDEDAIDAHPDLWTAYRAQVPRAYLAFGFTTIVDLDSKPAGIEWFKNTPLHPRFFYCGRAVTVPGGYGAQRVPPLTSKNFPNIVAQDDNAANWPKGLAQEDFTPARAVQRIAAVGATCLKVFHEPGFGMMNWAVPNARTMRALRDAASARHLTMFVHANNPQSWRAAISGRAEIIAHGLWIWPGNNADPQPTQLVRDAIMAAARSGVHVQPTLQVVGGERALFDPAILNDPRLADALPRSVVAYLRSPEGQAANRSIADQYRKASPAPGIDRLLAVANERARATFKLMLANDVHVIMGSDTPAGDGFGNPPGLNGILEMQAWHDAGAPLGLILRAATLDNAEAIGRGRELGSIEPGKYADLLLLRADPLASMSAYDTVETVFVGGEPIARDDLRPAN